MPTLPRLGDDGLDDAGHREGENNANTTHQGGAPDDGRDRNCRVNLHRSLGDTGREHVVFDLLIGGEIDDNDYRGS